VIIFIIENRNGSCHDLDIMVKKTPELQKWLKDAIYSRGHTLRSFSEKSGVTLSGLHTILNQPSSRINGPTFHKICNGLDLDPLEVEALFEKKGVPTGLVNLLEAGLRKMNANQLENLETGLQDFGYSRAGMLAHWMVEHLSKNEEDTDAILELMNEIPSDEETHRLAMRFAAEFIAKGLKSARMVKPDATLKDILPKTTGTPPGTR
jgi:hypothetical protein